MDNQHHPASFILTKSLTLLMAIGCGIAVANLYYIQPLEAQIAASFHVSQGTAGLAAMLTQIGYALGLLLFVPLGDICERKTLIIKMLLLVTLALLAAAWSPCYGILLIAMFAIGITTIVPQLIVPYAAHLAPPEKQGKVIGDVMSGLLIGILLSRTFSGIIGAPLGWRAVYLCASGLIVILLLLIHWLFPVSQPASNISYQKLLQSIPGLIHNQRPLRESAPEWFLYVWFIHYFLDLFDISAGNAKI